MAQREEDSRARMVSDEAASDEDLAAAMRTEPDAFVALYERYRHRVYAYALARVNSGDDAADLTQQVFLRAFDSLRAGRTRRESFASWLFTVAHNATVDFYRRRKPTLSWSLVPAEMEPLEDLDLDLAVAHGEDLARLRDVLETLSAEQRELLALRFAAGLTAREIGPVVGLSPAAVQKQIRRTLQRMKERYHADHER